MKRLSLEAMRSKDQRGISIVDALFAMVIASMIAAAVTTGLGNWYNIKVLTANQDAATQIAQGIIAKTSGVEWDKLGFNGEGSSVPPGTSVPDCPTAFRSEGDIGGSTFKTVMLPSGQPNAIGVSQTSVVESRGQKFCVITDVTWGNPAATGTEPVNSYGTKNVSVKVSWVNKGTPQSISVNSTRTPNIGEAIPTGISEGHDAEVSPLRSFTITKALHDGTNGKVCYTADWADTSDTIRAVGSSSPSLSPSSNDSVIDPSKKNVEECMTVGSAPSYAYYGLTASDNFGTKFVGMSKYQYPGSKLTITDRKLEWNTYPSTGSTTYTIEQSDSADFSGSTVVVAEITDSTYTMTETSSASWLRVTTENSDYSVSAISNSVELPAGGASPTPTPTPTAEPVVVTDPPVVAAASINSKADIVAYDASAKLWNYGTMVTAGEPRKEIPATTTEIPKDFFVTDWNNDGIYDLISQENSGELVFRKGLSTGGFTNSVIGTGWQGYTITVGKWRKTDTYPSVIARQNSTGDLFNYPNPSGNGFGSRVKIGTGWNNIVFNLADWDKDGSIDVLAKMSDGTMKLYRTNGSGQFIPESRTVIGNGWNPMTPIHSLNGHGGAGNVGLLARSSTTGELAYYQVNKNAFAAPKILSGGWGPYTIAGN